ncbi:MAG TPA: glutathione S-transferase family protein [Rhizomicrobium sp.]|jgi:glutathione S-transferase|nr:glutathione S-transferase family protein [Rhizomicrobium sp.]
MITLYHRPKTRSDRFVFLLEELGAPYDIHVVPTLGEGKTDPANPHPHAKVPAIRDGDDGTVVFESSAIALYLTDKFPHAGLGPKVGDKTRGAYVTWLAYYGGVLEPAFISKFTNAAVPRPMAGWVEVEEAMAYVIDTLSKGPYLLGDAFSAADVLYGTTFAMFGQSPMMPKSQVITDYAQRVTSRPAHARAAAKAAA